MCFKEFAETINHTWKLIEDVQDIPISKCQKFSSCDVDSGHLLGIYQEISSCALGCPTSYRFFFFFWKLLSLTLQKVSLWSHDAT